VGLERGAEDADADAGALLKKENMLDCFFDMAAWRWGIFQMAGERFANPAWRANWWTFEYVLVGGCDVTRDA